MKIVLNHKCYLTKSEFLKYQEEFLNIKTSHELIMCPSNLFVALFALPEVSLGVQDVSASEIGSHTGEIAASQLREMNVEYAIIGHSERRKENHEDEEIINKKIENLILQEMTPILCVGETKEEKEHGKTLEVIKEQLSILKKHNTKKIIIAYEPVWAIGTGSIPTTEEIDAVLEYIKTHFPGATLLYGGSANETNVTTLKNSKYIEGYLLGGLSLKQEKLQIFLNLC